MYESLLVGSGLTKNETQVYLALLKLGKAKAGTIIKEAKISSGKIYETLEKLSSKGLVKSVSENGVKHFIASNPDSLLAYVNEKEKDLHNKKEQIKNIIPELNNLRDLDKKLETVSLIRGFRGINPIVYDALEKCKEIKIMGIRSSKNVKFNNFWKKWHRRRIELKKKALMLFSDKGSDYWKFFKNLKYTEVRETLSFSPSAVMVIDTNVLIFSYDEELVCIHIVSKPISDSFLGFFNSLWKFSS